MKLFLASRVVHPQSMQVLEEFTGGLAGKKVAYIPTAANGEGWGRWQDGESWQTALKLDCDLSLVQLEDYRNDTVLKELEGVDVIWVAGGECGYLMYWMRRCKIDKHIRELLSGNTVYVGSSAGSMVAAKTLQITEWYKGDQEAGASIIPGLGLVDFDFYPHYTDDQYDYIKSHHGGNKIYLVKDGESVIVEDNNITVSGEERII